MKVFIRGHSLVAGEAIGLLLASHEPLSFWGGYNAATGEIIDRRHPLSGQVGTAKILAIPGTRGSSTTTAVLLEAMRNKVAPAGFVVTDRDTFLALASVVADEMYGYTIPVLQIPEESFQQLENGLRIRITTEGTLASLPKSPTKQP